MRGGIAGLLQFCLRFLQLGYLVVERDDLLVDQPLLDLLVFDMRLQLSTCLFHCLLQRGHLGKLLLLLLRQLGNLLL
ncbi:hypothetical protein D3C80_679180 [compost metagenome]